MISNFKRALAALTACLGLALPAAATTYSATDYTDLWGTVSPNLENGWGVNLIQQNDTIFATLFVYGTDNSARWYSASNLTSSNGGTSWTGGLAQTTGPYFGAAWSANATATTVGTMTINFSDPNNGTLTYVVNGVQVNKNIQRFTLRANNLTGNYLGGLTARCTNNQLVFIFDTLTVTHNSTNISMRVDFYNSSGTPSQCTFSGTYGQQGRLASVSGQYFCTFGSNGGNQGNFSINNLEASQNGFSGKFTGTDQFCTMSGQFGGVKDVF
jgi:hypothetical protein